MKSLIKRLTERKERHVVETQKRNLPARQIFNLNGDTDITLYCIQNGIKLFMGDDQSEFDFRARMESTPENGIFVIETVTKKEPYQIVSPYLGDRFVPCDTIVTWPTKIINGESPTFENGYAFARGNRLVTGEISGPKHWKHFDTGQDYPLPTKIITQFEPAIDLLEYLVGRKLIDRPKEGETK